MCWADYLMGLGLTTRVATLSKLAPQRGWVPAREWLSTTQAGLTTAKGLSRLQPGPTNAGLIAARACPGYYQGLPCLRPGLVLTTTRAGLSA